MPRWVLVFSVCCVVLELEVERDVDPAIGIVVNSLPFVEARHGHLLASEVEAELLLLVGDRDIHGHDELEKRKPVGVRPLQQDDVDEIVFFVQVAEVRRHPSRGLLDQRVLCRKNQGGPTLFLLSQLASTNSI